MKNFLILLVFTFCTNLMSPKSLARINNEVPVLYEAVQTKPTFPGGLGEFMNFVIKNYQPPSGDEDDEIVTGVLQVSIVIGTDGYLSKVEIIKEVGNAGKEVKRVLSKCPKWTPGSQNGVLVPVVYNFPVTIK